jgi:tetratricopeptide (TPR) repeat protein
MKKTIAMAGKSVKLFKGHYTSSYLKKFLDQEAEVILDELGPEIPGTTDGIKAKYFNSRGVLALHMGQREQALQYFSQAVLLRPNEKNFICNQLGMQFTLYHQELVDNGGKFPSDWLGRLEGLLLKTPDFAPAIRLKAYYLGETENADQAKDFLETSPAWTQDPISTRLCLAEIYKDAGNNIKALSLIEAAETLDRSIAPWLLSLKGLVQLLMALGETAKANEAIPLNLGTKFLDLNQLQNSYNSYLKALTEYSRSGFPLMAGPALVNYSNIACMLEKTEKAEDFCRQFLEKHQDNEEIQKALPGLFVYKGQSSKAIPYLKNLHRDDKKNSTIFKNLTLALLVAEDFEDLLLTIETRQNEGFLNKEEEGLSRTLAAMAFAELGEATRAYEQVQILKGDNNFTIESITAEAEVVSRLHGDKNKASHIYCSGISQYPGDFTLLTRYSCHLGSPNSMTAKEVVKVNEAISIQNQLAPEQYLWLIKGYLFLGEPEKAAEAISRAMHRYPEDDRFLFMQANVLLSLGDEPGAYHCVQEYIKKEKTYSGLVEGARLARDIGKEESAIKLFELAKDKTTDPKELGKIHCQLYVLKKRRGDPPKRILHHAMKFGENTEGDIEKEVQFFIMVMICPKGLDENDLEIKEWLKETQSRIDTFVATHPQHPSFRRIQWREGTSFQKSIDNILSDIVAMSLPYELSTTSLRLSARNQTLPLSLRRQIFQEIKSLFWFWELCTKSEEYAYAIHIWVNDNRMEDEVSTAQSTNKICIDITGLLTLEQNSIYLIC